MFLAKQDIRSIPFHLVHEKVTLASRHVKENTIDKEREVYDKMIARKEAESISMFGEADLKVIRETYPFTPPDISFDRTKAEQTALVEVIETLGLKNKASWFLPQLTSYISKMRLPRNSDGKIDGKNFLTENFGIDDWHKGLYRVCTVHQRGTIVPKQVDDSGRNYSSLVPLLMMPFKKYDDIPYSDWVNVGSILDLNLRLAMTCDLKLDMTPEEILESRDLGLVVKTGAKAGTTRAARSTFKLYGNYDERIKSLPWLAQVMATQIWVAHPTVRSKLMILDWLDWDHIPDPLIDIEIGGIPSRVAAPSSVYTEKLPWED